MYIYICFNQKIKFIHEKKAKSTVQEYAQNNMAHKGRSPSPKPNQPNTEEKTHYTPNPNMQINLKQPTQFHDPKPHTGKKPKMCQ